MDNWRMSIRPSGVCITLIRLFLVVDAKA
jgi:hypothetical protein